MFDSSRGNTASLFVVMVVLFSFWLTSLKYLHLSTHPWIQIIVVFVTFTMFVVQICPVPTFQSDGIVYCRSRVFLFKIVSVDTIRMALMALIGVNTAVQIVRSCYS